MDTNDTRFDELRNENLNHFEQAVSAFSDSMSLSIEKFYEGLSLSYQNICLDGMYNRESAIPIANNHECQEEQIELAKAPW